MRRGQTKSLCVLFFALFYCIESLPLGIGNLRNPGAGLLPFFSGVLLGCLSLSVLIKSTWGKEESNKRAKPLDARTWQKGAWVLGSLLFYLLLLERLGFIITTFLFMVISLLNFRPRKLARILAISFLTAFASYLLFVIWLKVQLPKGILGI